MKRSHRKHKSQKSESEEYDSLGSDTESGSGDHIRSRLDHPMHLDDHEANSYISEYLGGRAHSHKLLNFFDDSVADKTPHKIMVNYRL